jgi:hypothetical protein
MEGRIGVWTETRGDWKWLKESFKFDHYANNRCCHLCGASRVDPNMLYTQTGAEAGWQNTRVNHHQYIESLGEVPTLARVPGFFLTRVFIDSMHCVCMGVVPYVVGSVIWELQETYAFQDRPAFLCNDLHCYIIIANDGTQPNRNTNDRHAQGNSQKKRLEAAYTQYRTYCKQHDIDVVSSVWTPEKLNKKVAANYAFMKAKANQAKKMLPWTYEAALQHNTGSSHDQMRQTVLWGLCQYYSIIGGASRYLDQSELGTLQFAVGSLLSCYMALSTEAQEAGTKCWHPVPKFHMHEHIADTVAPQADQPKQCRVTCFNFSHKFEIGSACEIESKSWQVNPAHATCYADEDIVGRLAALARKVHRLAVTRSLLQRWRFELAWRWRRIPVLPIQEQQQQLEDGRAVRRRLAPR